MINVEVRTRDQAERVGMTAPAEQRSWRTQPAPHGRLRSFDVFDTVLTRAVGDPSAVSRIVAQLVASADLVDVTAEMWRAARLRSEHHLVIHRRRSATLLEIHEELALRLTYDPGLAAETAAAELAVEQELSRVVPGARQFVHTARGPDAAQPVIFVSDTALPASFLIARLTDAGIWRAGDRCYASCERRTTKAYGDIFDDVADDLQLPPTRIHHTGDNRSDDVGRARLAGWQAAHRTAAQLNRYERSLEREAAATAGLASWMAGASRLTRLAAIERGIDPTIAAVGAGVAAPLLVGFARWVLRSAAAAGIERLYFLSRDGEVLHDVARALQTGLGVDVDCRYLHVSRRSMGLDRDGSPADDRWDPTPLREYLRGQGVVTDAPTGIVDVGWRGNTNRVLSEHITAAGGAAPRAYYNVGLAQDAAVVAGQPQASRQYGWLFDRTRGSGMPADILGQVALVEMFTTASHGPVVSYESTQDGVAPVLVSERDRAAHDWGLTDLRWVVSHFATHVGTAPGLAAPADVRTAVWDVLQLFWDHPTDDEVRVWGAFPMDFDAAEEIGSIGQRITTAQGLRAMARGRGELRPHESWLTATAHRSSPPIALLLRWRRVWHRHGARIRSIPGRVAWELASRHATIARAARWMTVAARR